MEVTGWWTRFGGCVIWRLRAGVCLKTGGLLYKGEGKRTECSDYRGIILLSVVGRIYMWIYAGIPVDLFVE